MSRSLSQAFLGSAGTVSGTPLRHAIPASMPPLPSSSSSTPVEFKTPRYLMVSGDTSPDSKEESCSAEVVLPCGPLAALKSGLLSGRNAQFRTRLGTMVTLATNGAGAINAVTSVAIIAATSEFTSWASVFDEFFVHSMRVTFEPIDQYQTGPGGSYALPVTGTLILAPLYHGAATYASAASMMNNSSAKVVNTSRRFTYTWVNNESPKSKAVVVSATGSATASQGWCLTSATPAANYSGFIQYRNNTNFGGALSATIGEISISYDVSFRARA